MATGIVKCQKRSLLKRLVSGVVIGSFSVILFYVSLLVSSEKVPASDRQTIAKAIAVLEVRGFASEVFLLRHTATYRSSDNWFNNYIGKENAYAATNFPFEIITLYPDFYKRTEDDTERAMILLHEAQHLKNKDEPAAYGYVWRNRHKLGWTIQSYGLTQTFITIEEITREVSPEIFTCPEKWWSDCTEAIHPVKKY